MYEELTALNHSKATEHLIRFWLNLPRSGDLPCPKRSDFSSAQINGTLPEVFLSEWQGDDALVVVQSGTVLDRMIGMDMTGQNIFDVLPRELVEAEQVYYRQLTAQPCAGMISRAATDFSGRPILYRTVQLPLLDPFGDVRYFVGTGYRLPPELARPSLEGAAFNSNQLLERHFFDIGAGIPAGSDRV